MQAVTKKKTFTTNSSTLCNKLPGESAELEYYGHGDFCVNEPLISDISLDREPD